MKTKLLLFCVTLAASITTLLSADVNESKPLGLELSAEPYGVISWTGINGKPELGAGIAPTLAIGRNLTIVGFGEGDHEEGILVERLGAGLRYTAYLGKRVSLDGGVAGAYDLENPHFFLRLPLGSNLTFLRSKNVDLSIRAQYAFDISGQKSGKLRDGTATGRLFIGPVFGLKF